MNKNDIIKLTITDINPDGYGVGKLDGYVFFVRGTAPGDVIEAKILKLTKSYGYAKTERTVIESEHRAEIGCDTYFSCGGCAFRHIEYAEELKIKQKLVNENFERIGGLFIKSSAVFPSPALTATAIRRYSVRCLQQRGFLRILRAALHRLSRAKLCASPGILYDNSPVVGKWCDETEYRCTTRKQPEDCCAPCSSETGVKAPRRSSVLPARKRAFLTLTFLQNGL